MAKKEEKSANDMLTEELSKSKFSDMLELADNITDMSVSCISTGFPQLDVILHRELKGLPQGRDIELYSKNPESGKSSMALQIAKNWQQEGKRVLVIDIERTITTDFLHQLGLITQDIDDSITPVRIARPDTAMSAEEVLDMVREASQIFDLIIVDSVAAMDIKANLEKDTDENAKIGAMALLLSNFLRKNLAKKATVIWINQMRQVVGGYNPTGNIRYSTMGGRALGFFATIRIELSVIEKMKDANDNVYAYQVKVYIEKNKVTPQYQSTVLTYVMGDGFSTVFDYMNMALKLGVVEKKGAWLKMGDYKIQGELNLYKNMKEDSTLLATVRKLIDEKLNEQSSGEINN